MIQTKLRPAQVFRLHPAMSIMTRPTQRELTDFGSTLDWIATLPWSRRSEHEAALSAVLRGDLPTPYGMTPQEAARHYEACSVLYFDAETGGTL